VPWQRRVSARRSYECTVQPCHGDPKTLAIAAFGPGCASLSASCNADQAARNEAAQKLRPERLGLGLSDVEADDLAAAGLVNFARPCPRKARKMRGFRARRGAKTFPRRPYSVRNQASSGGEARCHADESEPDRHDATP
jgi:hypothetical protein